jgi:hypothetical protein
MQTFASASDKSGSAKVFFAATLGAAAQIKATAGQIYFLGGLNLNAATVFLQVFFKPLASVTLGTTAADFTIAIPTNATAGGAFAFAFPVPFGFPAGTAPGSALSTPTLTPAIAGLTIAATTTATGSTAGSVALTALYM